MYKGVMGKILFVNLSTGEIDVEEPDETVILTMGSPDESDSEPVVDLFRFITSVLGSGNRLHVITATRLAVVNQVVRSEEELETLYLKMKLPTHLAGEDSRYNRALLERFRELGSELSIR